MIIKRIWKYFSLNRFLNFPQLVQFLPAVDRRNGLSRRRTVVHFKEFIHYAILFIEMFQAQKMSPLVHDRRFFQKITYVAFFRKSLNCIRKNKNRIAVNDNSHGTWFNGI